MYVRFSLDFMAPANARLLSAAAGARRCSACRLEISSPVAFAVILGAAIFFTAASPIIAPISWLVASKEGASGCVTGGPCRHECRPEDDISGTGYIDVSTARSQMQTLYDVAPSRLRSIGPLVFQVDAIEHTVAEYPKRRMLRFVSLAERRSAADNRNVACSQSVTRSTIDSAGARRQLLGSGTIQDITQGEVQWAKANGFDVALDSDSCNLKPNMAYDTKKYKIREWFHMDTPDVRALTYTIAIRYTIYECIISIIRIICAIQRPFASVHVY